MKKELDLHLEAQMFVPCPKIVDNFVEEGKGYIAMTRIQGESIYSIYGDDPKKLPKPIWKQIHSIVAKLYYKDIHYVDITPFNFIVDPNEVVHILDFGDAYKMKVNWFLKDFLDGEISWNPDFE
jgi:tRNA A-37 threonylcarbamoyl transferase component Bud32